jgi:hypothetical protein
MKYSGTPVTAALEKLEVAQLFKKYPIFNGTLRVLPMITRSHHRQMSPVCLSPTLS